MRKSYKIILALLLVVGIRVSAQGNSLLKLLHTTALPGFKGDLDHSAVDLKGNRLFVTAEVHQTVEVFICAPAKTFTASRGLRAHPTRSCFDGTATR